MYEYAEKNVEQRNRN